MLFFRQYFPYSDLSLKKPVTTLNPEDQILLDQVKSAGIVNFIQSRDHYQVVRPDAPGIDSYVNMAKQEVVIVSINLMTGVPFHGLCDMLQGRLESRSEPLKVTISLLNPWLDYLMAAISPSVGPANLSHSIQDTLGELSEFRDGLSEAAKSRLSLRVHNVVPSASAIMLDANQSWGRIQLETKPYKAPLKRSFAIEFMCSEPQCLYHILRDGYYRIVQEGEELNVSRLMTATHDSDS